MVDLPEPESPITQKISPRATLKEHSAMPTTQENFSSTSGFVRPSSLTACIASGARSPNIFHTSSSRMTSSSFTLANSSEALPRPALRSPRSGNAVR